MPVNTEIMGGGASKDTEAQLDSDCSDQQSQDQVLVDEHVPSEFHGDNSLVAVKVEPLTNSLPTNGASFRPKHRFQPIRDSVRSEAPQLEDMVVELKKVNWHRLGIQLRVPPDRLDKIEEDYRSADRKLSEVLTYWLLNEIDPSWNKICEALGRIGEYGNIVREIKMNYCSIDKLRMFTRRCQHYGESFEISLCPYIHHKFFICPHYDIVLLMQSLYVADDQILICFIFVIFMVAIIMFIV